MSETLGTVYTDARAEVPGANTTNMPDATLLIFSKNIYRHLALKDMPIVTKYNGGTFGFHIAAGNAGTRVVSASGTNLARILAVRFEATDFSTTTGPVIPYVNKGIYDLESQVFPGSNGDPTMCYWEKDVSGSWRLYIHPGCDANDNYYSIDCHIFPTELTSGSSVLELSPHLVAMMKKMLAFEIASKLNKGPEFLQQLYSSMPDRQIAREWIEQESVRGAFLKGPGG